MQATLADAGVVVPVSRPGLTWAAATEGARAPYRGGEHGTPGKARQARDRSRALHSAMLGPCSLGEAIPRAPSLHRGGRHQAHRPRLERGDAPARGTRRGSTEGMAPWRHLTAGINPGRARPRRQASSSGALAVAPGKQNSQWVETPEAGERGGALPGSDQVLQITGPKRRRTGGDGQPPPRQRGQRQAASRGGGFTARGRARASNMRCRTR